MIRRFFFSFLCKLSLAVCSIGWSPLFHKGVLEETISAFPGLFFCTGNMQGILLPKYVGRRYVDKL